MLGKPEDKDLSEPEESREEDRRRNDGGKEEKPKYRQC